MNGHAPTSPSVLRHASGTEAQIAAGLAAGQVNEALSLVHAAFAQKFRIGFRDARDLVRLFCDAVDATSCFSARVNGQCAGILLFQTVDQEFFRLSLGALFTRFAPLRAVLMLGNLALLADSVRPEEFRVDALAVDRRFQGMGLGTALMRHAEAQARARGCGTMSLDVIGANDGAIRLYKKLGYRIVQTQRGFYVRLATGTTETHRMEKAIGTRRVPEPRETPPPVEA